MTEAQIRSAWRHHTANHGSPDQLVEALQGLQDGASAAQRERSAALLAEDARAADLGRALAAINADARRLESERLALGRPRRAPALRRAIFAMAAMLALAAVIALPQWRSGGATQPIGPDADPQVDASSFEASEQAAELVDSGTLFRSSFDS